MIKNILITGPPGCGKTTLIMEVLKELNLNAGGFYTSEIKENGIRKGFKIISLDDKEGILAHENIKGPCKVGKYRVNLKDLEEIGVKSILNALKKKVIVIDEIGLMELFSEKFKKAVMSALDSENKVLGTIRLKPHPFTEEIKKRRDTRIFYLKRENFPQIKKEIINFLRLD